jgi:hypothetical protein
MGTPDMRGGGCDNVLVNLASGRSGVEVEGSRGVDLS